MSTLKTFTSFNVEAPGFNEERLVHARRQYDAMVREIEFLPPVWTGLFNFVILYLCCIAVLHH